MDLEENHSVLTYKEALERRISSLIGTFTDALIISSRNVTSVQELQKERQKHLAKAHEYHENDIILLYNSTKKQVHGQKFNPKWTGPFWIEKKLDYTSVNIQMTSIRIIVQSNSQQTSLIIPTHYRRTRPQNFNRYIEDACNAEVDLDLELYDKGDILSLNGARFLTVANRAQRLLSVLGEFPIPQFKYITSNWLYHLTSVDFDYFIRKYREQLSQNMEHFAGAQY
ncbi:1932_t:CDS:2 [Diversispora eburnea]|uniref:1932_t:CDS:1 n=1 Tax=Diversispora eburnea TaxID=1213867 RepID=A0A9N9CKZ3_9GLOM|nr:1932_t:CDS:2 [Diversispora eburnea]